MTATIDLAGKSAVITGAASGIGLALAHRLGAAGMNLVIADIQSEPLAEARDTLSRLGYSTTAAVADVADAEQLRSLHDIARSAFGPVHVLCNSAGIGAGASALGDEDLDVWTRAMDVHLWSVIHGCKIFVPDMIEHGEGGHVINTASTAGLVTGPLIGPYAVSKYGVVAYSETLALEIGRTNVGVSVLCPSFVRTGIGDAPEASAEAEDFQDVIRSLVASGIEPSVIADAVHDAIMANDFWILPQEETRTAVRDRTRKNAGRRPRHGGLPTAPRRRKPTMKLEAAVTLPLPLAQALAVTSELGDWLARADEAVLSVTRETNAKPASERSGPSASPHPDDPWSFTSRSPSRAPPRRIVFDTVGPILQGTGFVWFESVAENETVARFQLTFSPRRLGWLFVPFVQSSMEAEEQARFDELKRLVARGELAVPHTSTPPSNKEVSQVRREPDAGA